MTLNDLLLALRQRLLAVMEEKNRQGAEDLFVTLSTLREISYATNDERLTALIVDLVDAARDVAMGVEGKNQIPSIDDIQAVLPPKAS